MSHKRRITLWWLVVMGILLWVACTTPPTRPPVLTPAEPTPLPTFTPVPTPLPNVLYVDPTRPLGPISPYVYGTNTGPWSFVPLELMPLAEEAGITYLRFPGGNYGDQYDLRKTEIDRFMTLCEQLGAEPGISVRLRGGTPEKAVALLRYANVEQGYNVRYWSIGNEPALYGDYDTERYNREWRAIAEALLEVDPDITLIGPDVTQWRGDPLTDPKDEAGRDWMRQFLLQNGDLVDIVAIHRYPFPAEMSGESVTVEALMANPPEWEEILPHLRTLIRETTGRDLPIAVTEVNSHWNASLGGEATPDSHASAIWWGDVLGRLIKHDVEIVAHFALQSSPSLGGWGLFSRYEARPAYFVYRMYQHVGDERLYASSADPQVGIYAAWREEDGAATAMVINRSTEARTLPLVLGGDVLLTAPVEVWRFDAEHQAEHLGNEVINNGDEITLPPLSMTLYVFPRLQAACETCGPGD
ncbi:MAG: hypothetical protein ACP5HM_10165 [Anaerolineae bacterium]